MDIPSVKTGQQLYITLVCRNGSLSLSFFVLPLRISKGDSKKFNIRYTVYPAVFPILILIELIDKFRRGSGNGGASHGSSGVSNLL